MIMFNKRTKITLFYTVFTLIVIAIWLVMGINKNLMIEAWIANISYVVLCICLYILNKNILNPSIIFMTFIFIFCNGQIFLYSLGLDTTNFFVFNSNTEDEILKALTYFIFSFLIMGEGLIIVSKQESEKYNVSKEFNLSIRYIGYLLCILSVLPYSYNMIKMIITTITSGYMANYTGNSQGAGWGYIMEFFIPSLLLILYSYKNEKVKRNVFFIIIAIICILNLFTGSRAESMSIMVILLVFYNQYIKKFNKKNFIILLIIAFIAMTLISIIAKIRSKINTMEQAISMIFINSNPVVETIEELGGTMNAWCLTDSVVPERQDFKYGESYVASFLMVIPSTFLGGYSFAPKAALDIWLQDILDMSYGPGFNIFAETYYNFGWYGGIAFAFILGIFFGKMFNIKSKDKEKNEIFKLLSLIFLFNSLLIPRLPFHSTIRNIFYMYILVYIMIILRYNHNIKRRI